MSDSSLERGSIASRIFGAVTSTFARNAITSKRLTRFLQFFLFRVTFIRAQKMVRDCFHKILSSKPGERFFYLFGGMNWFLSKRATITLQPLNRFLPLFQRTCVLYPVLCISFLPSTIPVQCLVRAWRWARRLMHGFGRASFLVLHAMKVKEILKDIMGHCKNVAMLLLRVCLRTNSSLQTNKKIARLTR